MRKKSTRSQARQTYERQAAMQAIVQTPSSESPSETSPKVCLVIATFRHDTAVEATLRAVHSEADSPFFKIIVVDSQGSGALPRVIEREGWRDVDYISFPTNIGSAGNFARRLRLAEQSGADFAYVINHDGFADFATVRTLLDAARQMERVGAVYPLRYVPSRDQHDLSGVRSVPLPFKESAPPSSELVPVDWGSSNQALYSMEPVRRGLLPWSELWFGWEDMEYGWQLKRHGYEQAIATRASAIDNYEYRRHRILGHTIFLSDKPAWYAYYLVRNLILMTRRPGAPRFFRFTVALRLAMEIATTTLFRTQKPLRFRLLVSGLIDGLRDKTGKGALP